MCVEHRIFLFFLNDVSGTPDIFILPPVDSGLGPLVIEVKSGSQRVCDIRQLRVYQWLLEQALVDVTKGSGLLVHNFNGWDKVLSKTNKSSAELIPWAPLNPFVYWADVITTVPAGDPVDLERCSVCQDVMWCSSFWDKCQKLGSQLDIAQDPYEVYQLHKMLDLLKQHVRDWTIAPELKLQNNSCGWYEKKTTRLKKMDFKTWVSGATERGVELKEALSYGSLTSATARKAIAKHPQLKGWLDGYFTESSNWTVTPASPRYYEIIEKIRATKNKDAVVIPEVDEG